MAWIFSVSVECGPCRADAEAVDQVFTRAAVPTRVVAFDGAWWCVAMPEGLSRSGVASAADADAMNRAGQALLDLLQGAPPFRYALVGVEAEGALTLDDVVEGGAMDGLVVSDAVWRRMGRPPAEAFGRGRRWWPWSGVSAERW